MPSLLPNGKQAYTTATGAPLVGGKVYTYSAGTDTPLPTYADALGLATNTNPVILDARGEAAIFWSGVYKIVLRDALGNLIWTEDNIGGGADSGSNGTLVAASSSAIAGNSFTTSGYYVAGDGGAAAYDRVSTIPTGLTGNRGYVTDAAGSVFKLRIPSGRIPFEAFGAKADAVYNLASATLTSGTDNRKALLDAQAFGLYNPDSTAFPSGPVIVLGFGKYYIGRDPAAASGDADLELHELLRIVGQGTGIMPGGSGDVSQLVFAGGHCSIRINVAGSVGTAAGGSTFSGFGLAQLNNAYVPGAHGFDCRQLATFERITFNGIGDTPIYSNVTSGSGGVTEGNSSHSRITYCYVQIAHGNGLNIGGGDASVWSVDGYEVHQCEGCAIIATPYYATQFRNILINGYGNSGVYNAGYAYFWTGYGDPSATQPGTNNNVWYNSGVFPAASARFPQWVSGTTYRLVLPVYAPSPAATWDGIYIEGQGAPANIGGLSWGTVNTFGFNGGQMTVGDPDIQKGQIVNKTGWGVTRRYQVGEDGYTTMGAFANASFAGTSSSQPGFGIYLMEYRKSLEGAPWRWTFDGVDQVFGYGTVEGRAPTWVLTGYNTLQDFGTGTPIPYKQVFNDIGLFFPDGRARLFGSRVGNPATLEASTPHAAGTHFLNAGGGSSAMFSCTASGTPGTWYKSGALFAEAMIVYDAPSIAGGGSTSQVVTVQGAALGDYVRASLDVNLGQIILSGQVTATNTVTVTLYNEGTSSSDLPSANLRVRVEKA